MFDFNDDNNKDPDGMTDDEFVNSIFEDDDKDDWGDSDEEKTTSTNDLVGNGVIPIDWKQF